MTPWLDTPAQWDSVVAAVKARGVMGCDTETYGHNVKTSTPAFRAKIDVWSLALTTGKLSPRGYVTGRACVLPLDAALYPPMREVLESQEILHVFHNAHHDQHAFANHGVVLGSLYDTLEATRILWPGNPEGYSLKPLRVNLLGKQSREGFKELTADQAGVREVVKLKKVCSCGLVGCKRTEKKWGAAHAKILDAVKTYKPCKTKCEIQDIVPGHERWQRKLEYAGDDAVDALELYQLIQRRIPTYDRTLPQLPW